MDYGWKQHPPIILLSSNPKVTRDIYLQANIVKK